MSITHRLPRGLGSDVPGSGTEKVQHSLDVRVRNCGPSRSYVSTGGDGRVVAPPWNFLLFVFRVTGPPESLQRPPTSILPVFRVPTLGHPSDPDPVLDPTSVRVSSTPVPVLPPLRTPSQLVSLHPDPPLIPLRPCPLPSPSSTPWVVTGRDTTHTGPTPTGTRPRPSSVKTHSPRSFRVERETSVLLVRRTEVPGLT